MYFLCYTTIFSTSYAITLIPCYLLKFLAILVL